jgi:uncharacterized lipoprotein
MLIAAAVLLSGCSWFHRDRAEYYKGAQETRPLEVPPDLDAPATARELVVPGTTASAAPAAAAASSGAADASASTAAAPSERVDLLIADSVANTYQRVGLALGQTQLGKVVGKDDATHSYAYDVDGASAPAAQPAAPKEHHWYSRVLHPFGGGGDKPQTQSGQTALRVNVTEDSGGARVSVVPISAGPSAEAAAQRVTAALRERLS